MNMNNQNNNTNRNDTKTGKYDDIINLPHHVSKKHAQMALIDRAAQFTPFSALTGLGAAIQERERLAMEALRDNNK